jgi:hypothetical protein
MFRNQMIDILLISDQPRLHSILNMVGSLPDGTLRISTNLNQGLKEIGTRAPNLLFLQNRLSGLAGSILVRHVRSELNSTSTRIILFTDNSEGNGESTADIELAIVVSDNELSDAITEIIGDQLGDHYGRPVVESSVAKLDSGLSAPMPLALSTGFDDTVTLSTGAPQSRQSNNEPQKLLHTPSSIHEQKDEDAPRQATILNSSPPPIQWEKKRVMTALSLLALFSISALLFYLLTGKPSPAKPRSVASPIKKQTAAIQKPLTSHPPTTVLVSTPAAPLPSFIPPGNRDPR